MLYLQFTTPFYRTKLLKYFQQTHDEKVKYSTTKLCLKKKVWKIGRRPTHKKTILYHQQQFHPTQSKQLNFIRYLLI